MLVWCLETCKCVRIRFTFPALFLSRVEFLGKSPHTCGLAHVRGPILTYVWVCLETSLFCLFCLLHNFSFLFKPFLYVWFMLWCLCFICSLGLSYHMLRLGFFYASFDSNSMFMHWCHRCCVATMWVKVSHAYRYEHAFVWFNFFSMYICKFVLLLINNMFLMLLGDNMMWLLPWLVEML